MANTALLYATAATNKTGVGAVAWSSLTNALGNNTVDATKSTVDLTGSFGVQSNYLMAEFTTGLASTDTITGLVGAVRRWSTLNDSSPPQDASIKFSKNGTPGGTERSASVQWPQTGAWSADYGTSISTSGLTLIGTDTIGLAVSVINNDPNDFAYITAVRITVYYTSAAGVPGYIGFFRLLA